MNNLTPTGSDLTQSDVISETELPPAATLPDQIDHGFARRLDRRGILQAGGVAALAGTAAVLAGGKAAGAATATGVMHFGASNGAGSANTALSSSNAKSTLTVKNAGIGHGL